MDEKLEKLHNHINELLKYAEAKNGLLLGFNGLVILEILKNYPIHKNALTTWQLAILSYVLFLNFVSFIVCLLSLFPNRKTKSSKYKGKRPSNLLYFGNIAKFSATELIENVIKKYELSPKSMEYCIDLAQQLIILSQILNQKFNKFRLASIFTLCAFTSPLGYLIVKNVDKYKN